MKYLLEYITFGGGDVVRRLTLGEGITPQP